jgi:hypothetical protein
MINFRKTGLEDGKTVAIISGEKHLLIGGQLLDKDGGYFDLSDFDENLQLGGCYITKIMIFDEPYMAFNTAFIEEDDNSNEYSAKLVWERNEVKQMTIKEIENELGYKIELVKEKE